MSRHLVILHHILWLVLWFALSSQYHQLVEASHLALPSNIQINERPAQFHGKITAYDYDNLTVRFQTDEGQHWLIVKIPEQVFEQMLQTDNRGTIMVDINAAQWTASKNTDTFDYDRYLFASHYEGRYTFINYASDHTAPSGIIGLRNTLYMRIKSMPLAQLSGILAALFFGNATAMDTYETYRALGVLHLFTISGLHFGVIYLMLNRIFCIGDIRFRRILTALSMLFFYVLIGGGIAGYRALLMACYAVAATLLKRPVDRLNMIVITNLIIMLTMPRAILTAAYALSFYAYIGVAYILPKFYRFLAPYTGRIMCNKWCRYAVQYLGVQFYLMPMTLYIFHEVNRFGFLANAFLIPVYGFMMPFLTAYLFLIAVMPGAPFVFIIGKVLDMFFRVLNMGIAHLPVSIYAHYGLKDSDMLLLLMGFFIYTAAVALPSTRAYRVKLLYCYIQLSLLIVLSAQWLTRTEDSLKIVTIDVGHGDSSLIQYRGLNVLVDSGTAYSNVYTYLLSHGVTHLDYVVFSHRHDDHIGGFEMIAKNLEINAVICLSDVQDMIESKGIACRFLPPSGTVTYGDLILNFDYAISETDANDNGTLVHLNLHHFDAVFAGDFSGKTLSSFHLPEDIDFLKVPHHGSITGYNEDFFSEHHTDVAVISQNRRYFMPATAVVDAYRSEGAKVFTTFQNGEISFLVNDHQLRAVDYYGNKYKATFDMEADG